MKKIMILGASVYQVPLIRTAKRMGLYTIVSSIPGEYPGFAIADKVYKINTIDKEAILQAAAREKIDGICTSGTDVAVSTIGYVCDRLGLSGITEESAAKVTDKAKMKEAFLTENVATAAFRKVSSLEEAYRAASELGYPVVAKRVDSSGSRGILSVEQPSELMAAYHDAISLSRKDYILIEKMLKGKEIGVDGIVQDKKLVFFAPHEKIVYQNNSVTIPVGHGFPYHGGEPLQREIKAQIQKAVSALGLNNCSVNADVFIQGDKAWIIEIGGRTGATCIPELISMHYGFDFYKKILQNALGITVNFETAGKKLPCMAKLLMSPADGTITFIKEDQLSELRSKGIEIVLDYPVGHRVERMINGTTRIGHVVAQAETEAQFKTIYDQICDCIKIDDVSLEKLWER